MGMGEKVWKINSDMVGGPALPDLTSTQNSLQKEATQSLEFMSTQILHTKGPAVSPPPVTHR